MEADSDPADRIASEFAERGIQRGGILFLQPRDAIDMVRLSKVRNVPILGIDGFVLTDSGTQPDMTNSIDVSSLKAEDSWAVAEAFLKERMSSGLRFEVVI